MTPSDLIAMTAVISTAVVAVVGFWVQTSIARKDRRRLANDARYAELARIYEEAGRLVATAIGWARRASDPDAWRKADEDPDIRAGNAALKRLRLYQADPEVIDALQHVMDGFGEKGKDALMAAGAEGGVQGMADFLDKRLRTFYITCGTSLARFRASFR